MARGRLHQAHRGVYRVGHTAPVPFARERAALLACGQGALLSHESAAAAWSLLDSGVEPVHVTVVQRQVRGRPGVRVHRVGALLQADVSTVRGLSVTAPARTIIDLAARAPDAVL